jgi:hypothetical protein
MKPITGICHLALLAFWYFTAPVVLGGNFSTGTHMAARFGVHEIVLTGKGSVSNPFDTLVTVRFTPPSGAANARTVWAFYDGENAWQARAYLSETGEWTWSSNCESDAGLHGKSGTFRCEPSQLRGRLLIHPKNPRQWMTEDGRWFLNVVDTAYFLLSSRDERGDRIPEEDFHAYVRDAVDHGITAFMAYGVPGPKSWDEEGSWTENYFADASYSTFRLEHFRGSSKNRGQPIYSFVFCLTWAADSAQGKPCLASCALNTRVRCTTS